LPILAPQAGTASHRVAERNRLQRRSRKLAPSVRPICLTLATSSDSVAGKIKPWPSKMSRAFYRDKQGIKGLAAPCAPQKFRMRLKNRDFQTNLYNACPSTSPEKMPCLALMSKALKSIRSKVEFHLKVR
jgi:hypothetical protein